MMTQWPQASLEGRANCDDSLGIDPPFVHVPKNYIDPDAAKLQQKKQISPRRRALRLESSISISLLPGGF